jgi:hypothetical protein
MPPRTTPRRTTPARTTPLRKPRTTRARPALEVSTSWRGNKWYQERKADFEACPAAGAGANAAGANQAAGAGAANGANVQSFAGDLGGAAPAVIQSDGDRPFAVNGATFVNIGAALQRSCAVQHNACASAANSGAIDASVGDCDDQEDQCLAASQGAQAKRGLHSKVRRQANNGVNVQTFTGNLGGAAPAVIQSDGDRPFAVNGATFVNIGAALQRSCAVQNNACSNAANSGAIDASVGDCGQQENACRAAAQGAKAKRWLHLKNRQAALDTGSCGSPAISFGEQADRDGNSFAAVNQDDFNHGSALNIGVISSFICQRLQDSCKAGAATVSACKSADQAARAATGAAAADAFNSALGV